MIAKGDDLVVKIKTDSLHGEAAGSLWCTLAQLLGVKNNETNKI